ncbi:MAG: hypothetical protein SF066_11935 [Thermoanaerobaculia bacterium]|nr:hypothetical protein [Thermoanaerobaculia bacterium]
MDSHRSALIFLLGCSLTCTGGWKERQLQPPLSKIMHHTGSTEYFVEARPGVKLEEIVSLEAFQGLQPETTWTEAASVLGPPVMISEGKHGGKIYRFQKPHGWIEIEQIFQGSEERLVGQWYVRYSPQDGSLDKFASKELIAALPQSSEPYSVSVSALGGQVLLDVQIGQVNRLWWLRKDSNEIQKLGIESTSGSKPN